MNSKVKAMLAANQVGWTRARKLCEFHEGSTPSQARSFLSENKKGPYPGLLISDACDKRNPTVRKMIREFAEYCKTNKGRAGRKNGQPETPAPVTRVRKEHATRSRIPDPIAGLLGAQPPKQKRTRKRRSTAKPTIDHEALVKLRVIAEEFGGIEKLESGLEILKGLQLK